MVFMVLRVSNKSNLLVESSGHEETFVKEPFEDSAMEDVDVAEDTAEEPKINVDPLDELKTVWDVAPALDELEDLKLDEGAADNPVDNDAYRVEERSFAGDIEDIEGEKAEVVIPEAISMESAPMDVLDSSETAPLDEEGNQFEPDEEAVSHDQMGKNLIEEGKIIYMYLLLTTVTEKEIVSEQFESEEVSAFVLVANSSTLLIMHRRISTIRDSRQQKCLKAREKRVSKTI